MHHMGPANISPTKIRTFYLHYIAVGNMGHFWCTFWLLHNEQIFYRNVVHVIGVFMCECSNPTSGYANVHLGNVAAGDPCRLAGDLEHALFPILPTKKNNHCRTIQGRNGIFDSSDFDWSMLVYKTSAMFVACFWLQRMVGSLHYSGGPWYEKAH